MRKYNRRAFSVSVIVLLVISLAAAKVCGQESPPISECYELRIYRVLDIEKRQQIDHFLEQALFPALEAAGVNHPAAFHRVDDADDHSVFVLIPYPDGNALLESRRMVQANQAYHEAIRASGNRPLDNPVFQRVESRLAVAMAGMPRLERPRDKEPERIFELRIYESHTEDHARRKILMFDEDEIRIMRESGLSPVFFADTIIASDLPNLMYMLTGENAAAHEQHWKTFRDHPDWLRIQQQEIYRYTVSKIKKWILRSTPYSRW